LNNTANIVTSGSDGEVLIASGCALVHLTKDRIIVKEILPECIDGTLVSLRMNLNSKIDIYKYLEQVKYELIL
jgi:hypothetical protein